MLRAPGAISSHVLKRLATADRTIFQVHRLLNPLGFAGGQLAVFQGASEAPLSES